MSKYDDAYTNHREQALREIDSIGYSVESQLGKAQVNAQLAIAAAIRELTEAIRDTG